MSVTNALRAVVFENPNARVVRFAAALQETRHELAALGFIEKGDHFHAKFTQAGYVGHLLAKEMNPLRRFARTVPALEKQFRWKFHHTVEKAPAELRKALKKLRLAGIAEIDQVLGKEEAWRFRLE